MSDTAAQLEQALALHRAGQLDEAARVYEQILELAPRQDRVWHLLGALLLEKGDADAAIGPLSKAIECNSTVAAYYRTLGQAASILQRFDVAELCLRQAHQLGDDDTDVELALVLHQLGRREEAITCYQAALQRQPETPELWNNLGAAQQELGRATEAVRCFEEALKLRPDSPESHNNLGNAWQSCGDTARAISHFRQAIALQPTYVDGLTNLANALKKQGSLAEAATLYRTVLQLVPDFADVHYNLGDTLQDQGDLAAAIACYERTVDLNPGHANAWNSLGTAQKDVGKFDEALSCYLRAITYDPSLAIAHYNLATTQLYQGDFENGWTGYEWRWETQPGTRRDFARPQWDGQFLNGRTILIHAEQGLGDTLQFVRYVSLAQERGGRVVLECQRALVPLLRNSLSDVTIIPRGDFLPAFDLHAPLLSLPMILGTTLATVPNQVPYLAADRKLVEQWQTRLKKWPGFKVGIHWQGNPKYAADRVRSVPLAFFEALADIPGVRLFSLQKGFGREQLANVRWRLEVIDLADDLDETTGAFQDTAAVLENLDLVVTSDTALPHLAGALAVPVWMVLPFVPDWRWLLRGADCPWYPSMRLYRQSQAGDWASVFQRVRSELLKLVKGSR